jgi:tRNA G18 (ribose-2'-O)-methylase SpoU
MTRKLTTKELVINKGDRQKLREKPRAEIFLILENIRSAHNVGAIFRTADAARVKKVYLTGITPHPPRPDLEKTALRTIEHVPWEHGSNVELIINNLKHLGAQIVALEQTDASTDYRKFNYKKPVAIVLGNEVNGVEQSTLELCDGVIEIPMHGIANSLNVTTAAGIILFSLI